MSGRRNSNRGFMGADYSSTGGMQNLEFVEQSKRGGYGGGDLGESAQDILAILVGGGGGSSGAHGGAAIAAGGGGAGGFVEGTFRIFQGFTFSANIGAGGAKNTGTGTAGFVGNDTTITLFGSPGAGSYFRALGGGGGGFYQSGTQGGCGGGSGYNQRAGATSIQNEQTYIGYDSAADQNYVNAAISVDSGFQIGFAGGDGPYFDPGPGGGGTAEDGDDHTLASATYNGAPGGDGRQARDGVTYGGGGGGGRQYDQTSGVGGAGGAGGGGQGAGGASTAGANGTDGLGGGGGGGVSTLNGGNGGSGVIVLYASGALRTTGSPTEEAASLTYQGKTYNKKYTFTSDGTFKT